ncbi:Acg family FMN-binding oxidoreductase [Oricola sp.]|uniref:Acg family FMN-binding oxidoreductase n=1 Tax=Oricola sp. TaxID=1979950 RepID=UPI003BA88DF1
MSHSKLDQLARDIRAPITPAVEPDLRELVRCATLAANSHNTQPWRFSGSRTNITIAPDLGRVTPVVDPDDRHLFATLGCAAENLAVAGSAAGASGQVAFLPVNGGAVNVVFGGRSGKVSGHERALYEAIFARQCTRSEYSGRRADAATLTALEQAAAIDGVTVTVVAGGSGIEPLIEIFTEANTRQIEDRAFKAELKAWLRFSEANALKTRDGLFSACTGNPSVPDWVGSLALRFAMTAASENEKLVRHLRSSAGLAVFTAERDDADHAMRAGRSCQRFALAATAAGLKHAFLNQPAEVAALTGDFASAIGRPGTRPNLIVRFGYADPMPYSLRRPVGDVIVDRAP